MIENEVKRLVASEISLPVVNSTPGILHLNGPSSYEGLVEHAVGSICTATNLELKMEEEIKPDVSIDILLAALVDTTSDILHPNEIKKEFSLSEPHSYGSIYYTGMDLELKVKEEIKPEVTSDILLTAIVDSTSGVFHTNEIKNEFLISEPHSYDSLEEHTVVKHENISIQSLDLK